MVEETQNSTAEKLDSQPNGGGGGKVRQTPPQGVTLSPLLLNTILDGQDKGLERRGHTFC